MPWQAGWCKEIAPMEFSMMSQQDAQGGGGELFVPIAQRQTRGNHVHLEHLFRVVDCLFCILCPHYQKYSNQRKGRLCKPFFVFIASFTVTLPYFIPK
jgi:hypothetical protein